MEPKTQFQKEIFKLSETLDSIPHKNEKWAEQNVLPNYYAIIRNRHFCLVCGHKWKDTHAALYKSCFDGECPSCKTKNLKLARNYGRYCTAEAYYAKIQVCNGYQVVRMFHLRKYMKKQKAQEFHHDEVMQHWIREDGKIESLQKLSQSFYTWNDAYWSSHSDMVPRSKTDSYYTKLNTLPQRIVPNRRTLPQIRRNGYNGGFYGLPPAIFFSAILQYPEIETLHKAGYHEWVDYGITRDGSLRPEIKQFWPTIRIALRHGFKADPNDYFDHLKLLHYYGRDLLNPHYVCPDDFWEEHQRYVIRKNREDQKARLLKKMKQIEKEEADYQQRWQYYFDLSFSKGNIHIVPFTSVRQFAEEGDALHHCIYASNYYKRSESLMLSARVNGHITETVQVDTEKLTVRQSRGLQNKPSKYHDQIIALVNENMDAIIACTNRRNIAEMHYEEQQLTMQEEAA